MNNADNDGRGCRLLQIPPQEHIPFQMSAHSPVDGDEEGNGKSKRKEGLRKGKWTVSGNNAFLPKVSCLISNSHLQLFRPRKRNTPTR
jgi:hypothetical protein